MNIGKPKRIYHAPAVPREQPAPVPHEPSPKREPVPAGK